MNPYFGPASDPDIGAELLDFVEQRVHPKYRANYSITNDVMLLKLSDDSDYTPVKLNSNPSIPSNGKGLRVLGWGTTVEGSSNPPPYLMKDTAFAVTNSFCQGRYDALKISITSDMLCAKDDGSCQGDSGGPLIIEDTNDPEFDVVVGVVSFGRNCNSGVYPGKCSLNLACYIHFSLLAHPNLIILGVYSRISTNWEWIRENACDMASDGDAFCLTSAPTPAPTTKPPTRRPTTRPPTLRPTPQPTRKPTESPSNSPSVVLLTPAPTIDEVFVLVRIMTDYSPLEISWKLETGGGKILTQRPAGYFTKAATIYDEIVAVPARERIYVEVYDAGGNGIFNLGEGYVTVYFGKTANWRKVLKHSDGRFTGRLILAFDSNENTAFSSPVPTITPTTSPSPTESPTSLGACPKVPARGCSICGNMACVSKPSTTVNYKGTVSCGELQTSGINGLLDPSECAILPAIVKDVCGCTIPTLPPSPQPSARTPPSVSPTSAPTKSKIAQFRVVFRTDSFPQESGWTISDTTGLLVKNVPIGTYTNPDNDETAIVSLELGRSYNLVMFDSYGDGNCKFDKERLTFAPNSIHELIHCVKAVNLGMDLLLSTMVLK